MQSGDDGRPTGGREEAGSEGEQRARGALTQMADEKERLGGILFPFVWGEAFSHVFPFVRQLKG